MWTVDGGGILPKEYHTIIHFYYYVVGHVTKRICHRIDIVLRCIGDMVTLYYEATYGWSHPYDVMHYVANYAVRSTTKKVVEK